MEIDNMTSLEIRNALLTDIAAGISTVWINSDKLPAREAMSHSEIGRMEIFEARLRMQRFATLIKKLFPETELNNGLIESDLIEINKMKKYINNKYDSQISGRLFLKLDSELPVAGSVKARGGIYEVLLIAEKLALQEGILDSIEDDYLKLSTTEAKEFFSHYTIQVGSTGNLGISVGIMGRAIGFNVKVHVSSDAKLWKKNLLREKGVEVVEYDGDYGDALEQGRKEASSSDMDFFIDDENSYDLILGYATAGYYLKKQLEQENVVINEQNPLFVYIPCGVGSAPVGIAYSLKLLYEDNVHVFFTEPVNAPCMLVGLVTGLFENISVQDVGLTGKTEADGLAVSRQSSIAGRLIKPYLSGEFTVHDRVLTRYLRALHETENIFIEPSSCSAFEAVVNLKKSELSFDYLKKLNTRYDWERGTHIVWATGGGLVPEEVRKDYLKEEK